MTYWTELTIASPASFQGLSFVNESEPVSKILPFCPFTPANAVSNGVTFAETFTRISFYAILSLSYGVEMKSVDAKDDVTIEIIVSRDAPAEESERMPLWFKIFMWVLYLAFLLAIIWLFGELPSSRPIH